MVLDQGRVVVRASYSAQGVRANRRVCVQEFDSPLNLFEKEGGVFRGMCEGSIGRKEIEQAARYIQNGR